MDTANLQGFKRKKTNASVMGDPQIRLTRYITVFQEKRSHASFSSDEEAKIHGSEDGLAMAKHAERSLSVEIH